MSGDTVNLSAQCYYVSPGGGSTNNSSFSDVLTSLGNGLVNLTGGAHGTLGNLTSSGSSVYTGLSSFLGSYDTAHTGYPKAYINWIFLDDQFNYVSALSGSVLAASSTYPAGSMNLVAPGGPITLNRSGYLYICVSNETTGWDVYFDNLSVQHKQGPLLEENHYYPFGLTMAGISDKAIKTNYAENRYRYNSGNELQNKEFSDGSGLEMYDAGLRQLDPQLGRFAQIDPLSERADFSSAYEFANNNPVSMNDPTGLKAQRLPKRFLYPSGGGGSAKDEMDEDGTYDEGSPDLDQSYTSADEVAAAINTLWDAGGGTWTNNDDGTGIYNFANPNAFDGISGMGTTEDNQGETKATVYGVYSDASGCSINYQPLAVVNNAGFSGNIYTGLHATPGEDPITVNLSDYEGVKEADAFLINLNAGFAALGGIGGDLTFAIINGGKEPGIYAYWSFDMSVGVDASASITEGPVNYNINNNAGYQLTPNSFAGKSESISWGLGPYSGQYQWANSNDKWNGFYIPSGNNMVWSAVMNGAGEGALPVGGRWNFSITSKPYSVF